MRLTIDTVGTQYAIVLFRTFCDPNNPEDMKKAHALQDAIQINQASPGKLELPDWDEASLLETRKQINLLAMTVKSYPRAFGRAGEVDSIQHLMGAAYGWGGNPQRGAMYFSVVPEKNDGNTPYTLTMPKDVPVEAFGRSPSIPETFAICDAGIRGRVHAARRAEPSTGVVGQARDVCR